MNEDMAVREFESTEARSGTLTAKPILYAGLIVGVLDGISATLEAYLREVRPIVVRWSSISGHYTLAPFS